MYMPQDFFEIYSKGLSESIELNKNFKFIFQMTSSNTNLTLEEAISDYKEIYNSITKINSGNDGPVVGVYINYLTDSYSSNLEALEFVFGPKENSTFALGYSSDDCFEYFKDTYARPLLIRMDFFSCRVYPTKKPSPEESADDTLTTCEELREIALSVNITGDIMCLVGYPSHGTSAEGVVGSVSDFQRFWCKIIEEIKRDQSHPQIIMRHAFDNTPVEYDGDYDVLNDPDYHMGWWRRRHASSFDSEAFLEKVEELEGGREPGKCAAECSFCSSRNECCERRYCHPDSSFQPFESGAKSRVCQSIHTRCAPRPPLESIASNLITVPTDAQIPSDSTETNDSVLSLPNIVIFILSLLIFAAVVVAFIYYRKEKFEPGFLTQKELKHFFKGSPSTRKQLGIHLDAHEIAHDLPYDENLEITNQTFKIYKDIQLSSGTYGVVYKGSASNEEVAVKTTLPEVEKVYLKALIIELKVLMFMGSHENIVNLLGACTSELHLGKLYLFLELCPMGNLLNFLRSNRGQLSEVNSPKENTEEINDKRLRTAIGTRDEADSGKVTCKDLLRWSIQIASAMGYLAEKRVIHADISARNILVSSRDQVKLTDFGLSRRLREYSNLAKTNKDPLTWRHMSIEALKSRSFSVESDIWSFGVTLWEMFSFGKVPYSEHSGSRDFVELLTDGLRLQRPQHAHPLLYEVMTSCWTHDVTSRPPITRVHSKLISALDKLFNQYLYSSPMHLNN